jgi:uncharacterized damage-inducible protein DinB
MGGENPVNNIALMARFNAWVNERVYDCIAGLTDADYRKDRKAYFGSIRNTLNHLLVVDRAWTCRIKGVDHGIRSLDQILYDDFETLRAARKIEDAALIELVEGLSDEELKRPITYRPMSLEGSFTNRCDRILITLFNHQTHHRGQIHTMLTQQDIDLPPLDVIVFLAAANLD